MQIVGHTNIHLSKDARSHDREIHCVIIYLNVTLNTVGNTSILQEITVASDCKALLV